jgi:hypothetical protein
VVRIQELRGVGLVRSPVQKLIALICVKVEMTKWKISARITRKTRLVARVLLRESEIPGKVEAAKFDQFVRTHHLEDRPVAVQMALMASHMVLHELKATTISTYLKKAATYKRAKWAVDDLRRVKRLATTIETLGGRETRREAPLWKEAELRDLILRIGRDKPSLRLCAEILIATPLRLCDLNLLTSAQVNVGQEHVRVLLAGGKTRKRTLDREGQSYAVTLFSARALTYLRARLEVPGPILRITPKQFANEMTHLAEGRRVTSYSFRNAYMRRLCAEFTDARGNVDWPAVAAITGHRAVKSIKSSYGYHLN